MATVSPPLQMIECGEQAAKHFAFDVGHINLNHGQLNRPHVLGCDS
jgi:hypothetical protein